MRAIVFVILLAGLTGCLAVSPDMMFYPTTGVDRYKLTTWGAREVTGVNMSDGTNISVFQKVTATGLPTIIFAHGNGGNVSEWMDAAAELAALPANVIWFDFPGYGGSTGTPSVLGVLDSSMAVATYARQLLGPQAVIVGYGVSMGSVGVAPLATRPDLVDAVVLEGAIASTKHLVDERRSIFGPLGGLVPVGVDSGGEIDNLTPLAQSQVPVVIFHSKEDRIVGVDHARDLSKAAGQQLIDLQLYDGQHHNDLRRVYRQEWRVSLRGLFNWVTQSKGVDILN